MEEMGVKTVGSAERQPTKCRRVKALDLMVFSVFRAELENIILLSSGYTHR